MTKNNQGTDRRPHATTRLARTEIQDLCHRIHEKLDGDLPAAGSRRLGLYQGIRLVLASLRHNLEQQLPAELFDISQPTVSRVLTAYTPLVADTLADNIPTADDWSEVGFSDSGECLVQAVLLWRLHSASTSLGVR